MPELTNSRRYLVLGICCLSLLLVSMDNTIINVALPAISADFHATVSDLQWTIDAYTVVVAALLILSGATGDRLGRRRVFQTGLAVFVIGSLMCSLAPDLGALVAFRMVQAVGGSMLNPVAMSIVTNVFTDPRERAKAIGIWGATVGVSMGLGPIVGGALTEFLNWRAIFWINIPIGVLAFILAAIFVPESRAPHPRRLDPVGQLLVIVVLGSITYAIIEAPHAGWASVQVWGMLLLGLAALAGLLTYERRVPEPLIDVRFFRSLPFAGATLIAVFAFSAFAGFLFLNTLYLQDVRGLSPLRAGLATVPMAALMVVCAPVAGRIVAARGARIPLLVAGVGLILGPLLLLLGLHPATNYGWILLSYVVFAIGFGMVNPPITNTAVSGMPREQAGVAAAFASTSRQVGSALGVAILGSILNAGLHGRRLATGFTVAAQPAWWVIGAAGLLVLILGALSTSAAAHRSAQRAAAAFEKPAPIVNAGATA